MSWKYSSWLQTGKEDRYFQSCCQSPYKDMIWFLHILKRNPWLNTRSELNFIHRFLFIITPKLQKEEPFKRRKIKKTPGGDVKKLPTNQPFWNNGNNCTYFSTVKELKCRCILTQINLNFPLCTIEAVNWRKTDVGRLWGDESFLARWGLGSSCSNKLIFKTICFVIALNPGLSIS